MSAPLTPLADCLFVAKEPETERLSGLPVPVASPERAEAVASTSPVTGETAPCESFVSKTGPEPGSVTKLFEVEETLSPNERRDTVAVGNTEAALELLWCPRNRDVSGT